MEAVIQTEGLTRRFGRTDAVRGLTLEVPRGSIFAFLGPNGAGKTTTIQMLMNILDPTRGSARVLGTPSAALGPAELARIGYVSESQTLPGWMTVEQLAAFCRPLYATWDDVFCSKLLDDFRLPPGEKIRNLSRGMKVKTALACSLAYRPSLLVLDEPFSGLDPVVREELIRGVLEWTDREGWSIFVSSQDVDEVERLADRVGFLESGELVTAEPIEQLQARFRRVEVVLADEGSAAAALPAGVLEVGRAGRTLRYVDTRYSDGASEAAVASLFPAAVARFEPMSLRDIFVALARGRASGRGVRGA